MKPLFATETIPQANSVGRVVAVVEAVDQRLSTPEEIASALSVSARQGLYYRSAALSLKLVKEEEGGLLALTGSGRRLLAASSDPYRQQRVLRETVLKSRLFREIHARLSSRRGQTPESLVRWLVAVSELNATTASRRLSSIVNWLLYVGLAYESDGRLRAIPVQ